MSDREVYLQMMDVFLDGLKSFPYSVRTCCSVVPHIPAMESELMDNICNIIHRIATNVLCNQNTPQQGKHYISRLLWHSKCSQ